MREFPAAPTEKCPKCSKWMIQRWAGMALATYPPHYAWYWWCRCGAAKDGGMTRDMTEDEKALERWKELNDEE